MYHPYFVRGDINDDGVLDFVLAFVRRDSGRDTPWFSVVVFTGKERPGRAQEFSEGAFIERDVSLARGDVSIDRDAVLITPDLSDEAVRRYRWDPLRRSHVFVRDDEEEAPPPPVSRTESDLLSSPRRFSLSFLRPSPMSSLRSSSLSSLRSPSLSS